MAATPKGETGPGNEVPHQGDHDRVQMLSLRADGTPDQHNPELIGDEDATRAATREQFRQQAVSAVDVAERHTVSGVPAESQAVPQDPRIEEVKGKIDAAADAASSAADSAVDQLLPKDDDDSDANASGSQSGQQPRGGSKGNTAAQIPAGERAPVDKP